jgi:uncharacterized phage-associated protein
MNFKLNSEKAINSLLFVVNSLEKADAHKVYKILYFADQKHLTRYGRPIIGDTYLKMEYGPVPSYIRNVVDGNIDGQREVVAKYNRYLTKAIKEVDLDCLSETDIECLKDSIEENQGLSFKKLTNKSHDSAWEESTWNIENISIAKAMKASNDTLKYIKHQMVNENLVLR